MINFPMLFTVIVVFLIAISSATQIARQTHVRRVLIGLWLICVVNGLTVDLPLGIFILLTGIALMPWASRRIAG